MYGLPEFEQNVDCVDNYPETPIALSVLNMLPSGLVHLDMSRLVEHNGDGLDLQEGIDQLRHGFLHHVEKSHAVCYVEKCLRKSKNDRRYVRIVKRSLLLGGNGCPKNARQWKWDCISSVLLALSQEPDIQHLDVNQWLDEHIGMVMIVVERQLREHLHELRR